MATADAEALGGGIVDRENLGTKSFGHFFNHLEGDVLTAFFDAVNGGLAGADSAG